MVNGRTILMCGGPADGRWIAVPPGQHTVDVAKPVPVRAVSRKDIMADVVADLERVRYHVVPVQVVGHELWVGVCEDGAYDDRDVLRALLQRDVAAHLGAYR